MSRRVWALVRARAPALCRVACGAARADTPADTSLDRMALEVASQVMREKESSFNQLSPEGRKQLRDEMLRQLKERDQSK